MDNELFFKLLNLISVSLKKPKETLLLNAQLHPLLPKEIHCYQPKRGLFLKLEAAGHRVYNKIPEELFEQVIIYPSNSAAENYAYFAYALKLLKPNGLCISALSNNFGARRFEEKLGLLFKNICSESKFKARVFWAEKTDKTDAFLLNEWLSLAEPVQIPQTNLFSTAGIFSENSLDEGSKLLAEHLSGLKGTLLDLGAGNGMLTEIALNNSPEINMAHLAEHDYRALNLAEKTLSEKFKTKTTFHWWDISEDTLPKADAIISNPPYHSNFALDLNLLSSFVEKAYSLLNKGGIFRFVTQKTFKIDTRFPQIFKHAILLADNEQFKVYEIHR